MRWCVLSPRLPRGRRGAVSAQILVLLVPVFFGFLGFAIDLGRLYMIRGELKTAADAMAMAAAAELIGTDSAADNVATAITVSSSEFSGFANRYDYGGRSLTTGEGDLQVTINEPEYFETRAAATGEEDESGGIESGGGAASARHVRLRITADAPLVFWSFLPLGQERRTQIQVESVAGVSAPLCTACGIEAIAIAALDDSDTEHFGFQPDSRYTLGYVCNGAGTPGPLPGTAQRIPYLLINRYNEEAEVLADEQTQTYRIGAGGLPGGTTQALSCVSVDAAETVWPTATPLTCQMNRIPPQASAFLCGLARRFESEPPEGCENLPEVATASLPYSIDTDLADVEAYASYTGNTRRIITVAVVDSLTDPQAMTVLGFRQFLLEPTPNFTGINVADQNGRFTALYIGSVMPLRQGRFDGCLISSGPGKVVLHK